MRAGRPTAASVGLLSMSSWISAMNCIDASHVENRSHLHQRHLLRYVCGARASAKGRVLGGGHGGHGAEAYVAAETIRVPHESLKPGDACPKCQNETVYEKDQPGHFVRIRGQAPLGATVYELQKLRGNLCGTTFTAQTPPGVGPEKYDAEAASMSALLKYGTGLPFNRLERLEGSLGLPLPATTQWGIAEHRRTSYLAAIICL